MTSDLERSVQIMETIDDAIPGNCVSATVAKLLVRDGWVQRTENEQEAYSAGYQQGRIDQLHVERLKSLGEVK